MRIFCVDGYEQMSKKAASFIAAQVLLKPDCVLGLATGSSPIGIYKELIENYKSGIIDFSQVKTVNLDEYKGLDGSNENSYKYFMKDNLFAHINIKEENIHIPNGAEADFQKECGNYEKTIEECGGIDLQLLGIGINGHIGFNEPAESFAAVTHYVDLTQSTIEANTRFFEKSEDVPRKAYTMGIGTIMKADTILLIANGKAKAQAIKAAIYGPITPQVPASALQLHKNVIVVADKEAMSLI